MKFVKFVIQYRYDDGRDFLGYNFYDSFDDAFSQLCYNKVKESSVLEHCDGIQIKRIEFDV